jgi:hypothetical protein
MSEPLGKIDPIKAYQTTDGKKFVGERAREDAEDHQRWLDSQPKPEPPKPSKPPLKKLKRRKSGRKNKH